MGNESLTLPETDFFLIQTQTGWGRVLQTFAEWCHPQQGWRTLDVGSGPGLLPALFSHYGCQSIGVDFDQQAFYPNQLHPDMVQADIFHLPFSSHDFDLVSASNLLFFLSDPLAALREMVRVLRPSGQICLLNPSERMSVAAAAILANQHNLEGVARASLLTWADRAEAHFRWDEDNLKQLFAAAEMKLEHTALRMGPGLARLARATRK